MLHRFHFTDEEAEEEAGSVSCPGSQVRVSKKQRPKVNNIPSCILSNLITCRADRACLWTNLGCRMPIWGSWFKYELGSSLGEKRRAGRGVLNLAWPMVYSESLNLTDGQDLGSNRVHFYSYFTDGENRSGGRTCPRSSWLRAPSHPSLIHRLLAWIYAG